jgi:hypothetical protein
VSLVDVTGEPGDDAARVALPIRGEQPREGGDEVAAAVVVDGGGELFDLGRALDHAEVVSQPLNERAGDRDGALEAVDRVLISDLVTERREQTVLGLHRLGPGIEQQEVTGAVRVLGLAHRVAGLTEHSGLLVAQHSGQRDPLEDSGSVTIDLRRGPDLRQHGPRDVEKSQDVVVPVERLEIHHQRSAGIGDVGDVQSVLGAPG